MKTVLIAGFAAALSASALAQTTIYKLIDDSGRVTYSNRPMKGASVVELDPVMTIPTPPAVIAAKASLVERPAASAEKDSRALAQPAVAVVTPMRPSLASIDVQTQRRRDDARRRILEDELRTEEQTLDEARGTLSQEQRNPTLIAAVRSAQAATDPSPSQLMEFRQNIDKASGRIRGLQATVAEHEKNVEALKKELGALKP
jgi:outer membrane murein-binding lipoprotein Lpp